MKLLTCSIALLLSLCSFGQTKLLHELDSNISHPIWVASAVNNALYFSLQQDNYDIYLYDTILIANIKQEALMGPMVYTEDNISNAPASPDLIAYSTRTGKILWYVMKLPQNHTVSVTKYGIICAQPGGIQCYNLGTGETKWWYSTKDKVVYESDVVPFSLYNTDSLLYVLYTPAAYSVDTARLLLLMSEKTGQVLKKYKSKLPKNFTTLEYVYKNCALLSNATGLSSFDIDKGKQIWAQDIAGHNSGLRFWGDTVFYKQYTYESEKKDSIYEYWKLARINTGQELKRKLISASLNVLLIQQKSRMHFEPEPWFDGDTGYFYRYCVVSKYNMRTLQKIGDRPSQWIDDYSRNCIFTDEHHFYYTSGDTLYVTNKFDTGKITWKYRFANIQAEDIKQNDSLLFLSSYESGSRDFDEYYKTPGLRLTIINKNSLSYPLTVNNMNVLYIDNKNGFLYLNEKHKGLMKVTLPKQNPHSHTIIQKLLR